MESQMSNSKYMLYHLYFNQQSNRSAQSQFLMIIARKILRNALSLHPLLQYLDSTQPSEKPANQEVKLLKISPQAQRALWANHFIKTIISQDFQTNLKSLSLREKLINSKNPISDYKFDQAIKKEMTGIFKEGAILNMKVFDQERIKYAKLQDRLAFYPSILVTKQIFNKLHYKTSRIMFQGSYGIGKTISIAFYIYLSNIINRYALLAARSENAQDKELYKALVNKNYLPLRSTKYWYWSIDWNLVNSENFSFQRILAEQASELTQDEREQIYKCGNIEEAHEKIGLFYKKANFTHIAVLDQVNHAISFIRKWNSFVQENEKLIKEANKKINILPSDEKRIKQILQPTTRLISLAKQFTAINQFHYVLNSSVYIEEQLLVIKDKNEKLYQPLTLELKSLNNNHSSMPIIPFPFQKTIQSPSGRIHFWRFFCDILEENSKDQRLTQQEWKQIKDIFLKQACTKDLKSHYRLLHIRQFLQSYKLLKVKIFKGRDRNKIVKEIIYDFKKYSFYEFQDNVRKFLKKGNTTFRRSLLRAIYVIASQQKDKTKKLVVDFGLVGIMMWRPELKNTLRQYFVSSEPNSQTIPVEDIPQNLYRINISWTAQDFMLISSKVLFEQPFNGRIVLPNHEQFIVRTSEAFSGIKVANLLNQLLVTGTKLKFTTVKSERIIQQDGKLFRSQLQLKKEYQLFEIFDTENFISFDTAYKANSKANTIEQHFEKVLSKCAEAPGQWIASLPVKKPQGKGQEAKEEEKEKEKEKEEKEEEDEKQEKYEQEDEQDQEQGDKAGQQVHNDPYIDFALVKCKLRKDSSGQLIQEFVIHTYDAAVARGVSKKERNAKSLLEMTTKDLKRKIRVHHHILCLKDRCLPVLPVNEVADISYSSIEELRIEVVPEKYQAIADYKEVLGFVRRLLNAK